MRKIEKTLSLAIAYKKWLETINKSGNDHPAYHSQHRYYKDIVGNLLWVQGGLCAYTEMYLVNKNEIAPSKWIKGSIPKFDFLGQLDHYDSSLKKTKGWEWTNFFVIHSDVNVKRKGQKEVNALLKPDAEDFNPFHYLEYDFKAHSFLPNSEREINLQKKILNDINVLGLNFKPIVDYRKEYLNPLIDDVLLGKCAIDEARKKLYQFYNGFEMSLRNLGLV